MLANISFSPPPNYSIEIPELPETDDEDKVAKTVDNITHGDNEMRTKASTKEPYPVDLIKSQDIASKSEYEKKCIEEKRRYGTAVLSIHPAQYMLSTSVQSRLDGVMREEMEVQHITNLFLKIHNNCILYLFFALTYIYCVHSY